MQVIGHVITCTYKHLCAVVQYGVGLLGQLQGMGEMVCAQTCSVFASVMKTVDGEHLAIASSLHHSLICEPQSLAFFVNG